MAEEKKYKLDLPFHSRYKQTPLYLLDGKGFLGRWRPPEITLDGDEERKIVDDVHAGDLTKYADEAYGDPELFWVIAYVNQIGYPPEEVVAGMTIIIPKQEHVNAALQTQKERQESVV